MTPHATRLPASAHKAQSPTRSGRWAHLWVCGSLSEGLTMSSEYVINRVNLHGSQVTCNNVVARQDEVVIVRAFETGGPRYPILVGFH